MLQRAVAGGAAPTVRAAAASVACRPNRVAPRCAVQGMTLVPQVTELMLAELLYLQYENPNRPIYMYINSTGVAVRAPAL